MGLLGSSVAISIFAKELGGYARRERGRRRSEEKGVNHKLAVRSQPGSGGEQGSRLAPPPPETPTELERTGPPKLFADRVFIRSTRRGRPTQGGKRYTTRGVGGNSLLGDLADVVEGVRASLQRDVVPRRDFLPTLSRQRARWHRCQVRSSTNIRT